MASTSASIVADRGHKPPHLRDCKPCAECRFFDGKGKCLKYSYPVEDDETCDSFQPLPKDQQTRALWSAHRKRLERS